MLVAGSFSRCRWGRVEGAGEVQRVQRGWTRKSIVKGNANRQLDKYTSTKHCQPVVQDGGGSYVNNSSAKHTHTASPATLNSERERERAKKAVFWPSCHGSGVCESTLNYGFQVAQLALNYPVCFMCAVREK